MCVCRNYSHILIFFNKKDTTYDILYEFDVHTDTPSKFTAHTYTY